MNLTNIRPFKVRNIPWGWTNWNTVHGVFAHDPPGKIKMPPDFLNYFDWNRFEVSGNEEGMLSTQDHKSIFTTAARFLGYEELLIQTPSLKSITDTYVEWNLMLLDRWGKEIKVFLIGDDIAHRENLMLSPAKLREWYFPELQRLIDVGHKYGCLIMFHSDGKISGVLDDLNDLGIDYLWLNGDDLVGETRYKGMEIIQNNPHMEVRSYDVINPKIQVEFEKGVKLELTSRELVNLLRVKANRGDLDIEAIHRLFKDLDEIHPDQGAINGQP